MEFFLADTREKSLSRIHSFFCGHKDFCFTFR